MKKRFFAFFLLFLLTFSACSKEGAQNRELISSLTSLNSAEYTAKIRASFPSREEEFTLDFSYSPEKTSARVISPDEVSDVTYSVSDDGAFLEFDETSLEIGELDKSGISPFSCLSLLINSWKTGNFEEISPTEIFDKKAYLTISYGEVNTVPTEYRTWFSEDSFLPLYSEIFSNGKRIITCNFERVEHTSDEISKKE